MLRQRLCNVERQVGTLYGSDAISAARPSTSACCVFRGDKVGATPSDTAWPRSTEAIRPSARSHNSIRASSSAARAISSTDASMCRSAKLLRNASIFAAASVARHGATATTPDRCWPRRACVACRAARRRAQPTCRTAQSVSRHQPALWIEHRRHDARQLVDNRWRKHRVGECGRSKRASAAAPCCQCRAARSMRCARTTTRRASRASAPASPPGQARACALALPIAGACTESSSHSTVRVNAVRDEAQRRSCSDLDADDPSLKPRAHSGNSNDLRVVLVV